MREPFPRRGNLTPAENLDVLPKQPVHVRRTIGFAYLSVVPADRPAVLRYLQAQELQPFFGRFDRIYFRARSFSGHQE